MTAFLRVAILFSYVLIFIHSASFGQSKDTQLLEYNYIGTGKSGVSGQEFAHVMANCNVQKALLEVAATPQKRTFFVNALKGTGVILEDLQKLRLIRREGDNYVLGFALLTSSDFYKIRSIAEVEGKTLATALLTRRTEIQEILVGNTQSWVDWKAMAYFIIGCVSLDWDGLNLVREKGYLAVPEKDTYIPQAFQLEGRDSIQGLYWGSHNYHDEIAFTSFGDHHSLPRQAFPDLLGSLNSSLSEKNTPQLLKSSLVGAAQTLIRRRAGMIMLSLRDGEKTKKQLAVTTGLTEEETAKLLVLLLQLNYISSIDDRYHTIIPVLDERDSTMVKKLRRLGYDIMTKWLDEHYKELSQQLSDLTFVRYGVPFSEGFYWIWHYLFGIANRELVAAGLFVNPYDSSRTFKGFIPAVYLLDVTQNQF